jgi:hypothetical protein
MLVPAFLRGGSIPSVGVVACNGLSDQYMNRRSLIAAIGTATVSTILGTDAFSSVSADRGVDVQVSDDSGAYLSLRPADGPNGKYAESINGELKLLLSGENRNISGTGINTNSLTRIRNIFVIENQGTQEVGTRIQKDLNILADAVTFTIDKSQVAPTNGGDKPEPEFGSGYGINKVSRRNTDLTIETVDIGPGESVAVGLRIDTRDNKPRDGDGQGEPENRITSGDPISGSITIQADRDITNGVDVSKNGDNLEAAGD